MERLSKAQGIERIEDDIYVCLAKIPTIPKVVLADAVEALGMCVEFRQNASFQIQHDPVYGMELIPVYCLPAYRLLRIHVTCYERDFQIEFYDEIYVNMFGSTGAHLHRCYKDSLVGPYLTPKDMLKTSLRGMEVQL